MDVQEENQMRSIRRRRNTDLDLSVGDQRRAFDVLNKAKGGSVDAYNVLKLINDTMNDGQT